MWKVPLVRAWPICGNKTFHSSSYRCFEEKNILSKYAWLKFSRETLWWESNVSIPRLKYGGVGGATALPRLTYSAHTNSCTKSLVFQHFQPVNALPWKCPQRFLSVSAPNRAPWQITSMHVATIGRLPITFGAILSTIFLRLCSLKWQKVGRHRVGTYF